MSNEERVGKHADVKCWMNWKSLGIFDETYCLACGIIILFVNGETSNGMEEEVAVDERIIHECIGYQSLQ